MLVEGTMVTITTRQVAGNAQVIPTTHTRLDGTILFYR